MSDLATRGTLALVLLAGLAACKTAAPAPQPQPVPESNARVVSDSPVQPGDCVEARRRAAANPALDVDRLPQPVAMKPLPFQKMPAAVSRDVARRGSAIRANILIDTLGKPVLASFKVDTVSHPWLSSSLATALARWTFSPAELAGCKVPRIYKFSATSPARAAAPAPRRRRP